MSTDRCVKWCVDAQDFFDAASDKSIVLDIVISIGCMSQTGEGFEELVNAINNEKIKRKIKEVNILDTSYLYRHSIPRFSQLLNKNVQSEWFFTNKEAIEKIKVPFQILNWADHVHSKELKEWNERIRIDFAGDENGNGLVQNFRDMVLAIANENVSKGNGILKECIDFILEECAYTCAYLKNTIMIYPSRLGSPVTSVIERYNLNIRHFPYKLSNHSDQHKEEYARYRDKINREVVSFFSEKADHVNFFVIDKFGDFIYKNNALDKIIGNANATNLAPATWENTLDVMRQNKEVIIEEADRGKHYLSVKAPLIIDGEVDGVIGTAIDITDRKKAEDHARMQACYESAKSVAHDVLSPLLALKLVIKENQKVIALLDEEPRKTLRESLSDMTQILESLVYTKKHEELVPQALYPLIERCLQARRYISSFTAFDLVLKEPVEAKVDPLMFRRVFDNLLSTLLPPTSKDIKLLIEVGRNTEGNPQVTIKDESHIFTLRDFDEVFEKSAYISDDSGISISPTGLKKIIESWNGQLLIRQQNDKAVIQIIFPKVSSAEKVVPFTIKEPTFA